MPNRPTSELVLLTGYDPVIRVPQTRVLPLHQSSVKWCPWRDSNSQHLDSKSSASTNWTTGAISLVADSEFHLRALTSQQLRNH